MPEIQVFRPPRPKKSVLPPPSKKRKTNSTIEEINFDFSAREDYLTGFHKRKLQRVKMAQEEAAKKEREERIRMRKQVRELRPLIKDVREFANICSCLATRRKETRIGRTC